jgi:aryl-alcohol dehydrogenase-like predicted oxidoreductase/nucleoside-diphosphate-sugar epimerase
MKILLVGGNRFVGVEIAWQLLRAGHELTVLALDAPPADMRPHVRWLTADRNNEECLKALFADSSFDAVIDNIAFEPYQVGILCRVLQDKVGRYLLTSTTDVYPGNFPRTYTEDQVEIREYDLTGLEGAPRYMYGKRGCEAVLRQSGIPWTIVRPCIVTGPRDNRAGAPAARPIHWFEDTARSHFWPSRVLDGGPILMCREDEGTLQLVWVGDVARAVTRLISNDQAVGQAYNLTGSEIWSNERLVCALGAAAGRTPEIVHAPRRLIEEAGIDYSPVYGAGAYWSLADNAKLRKIGWSPTPAEQWMPFLLEELPPPISRPWYHTRLHEIALAHHIKLRQINRSTLPPSVQRLEPLWPIMPVAVTTADLPLTGSISKELAADWQDRICRQATTVKPRASSFNCFRGAEVSGIGIGTWMGALTPEVDQQYIDAITHAACRGINVFDTAINYRNMKAERCVGAALCRLEASGQPRGSFLISSKGGYVTHDADDCRNADDYLRQEYLETGLLDEGEFERRHAALNPRFIARQIDQSLSNLGVETIDLYYLHNPEEIMPLLEPEQRQQRLAEVFAVLEAAVAAGKIGCYGLATWHGLRVPPTDTMHLSLEMAVSAARDAAYGGQHHLAAVQMPFNPIMNEAFTSATQEVKGQLYSALEAAQKLGLYTFTSASVLQGAGLDDAKARKICSMSKGMSLPSTVLQVVRSIGLVGTALAGMRQIQHVEDAIEVLGREMSDVDYWQIK